MFIKSIELNNFKSYKNVKIALEERVNIIVGRNGSGKSNLFNAVKFILNLNNNSLTKEERQSLLHDNTLSCFVEIVFDNSDFKLPTNTETVTLRRTIGLKKDEYSIDKKSATKMQVQSLLESVLSNNCWYIIEQGKIQQLSTLTSELRLKLIKDVSGIKVYETKRKDSIKLLNETDSKITKINDLIELIDKRLNELVKDKKKLEKYNRILLEKNSVEHHLYTYELNESNQLLQEIDHEKANVLEVKEKHSSVATQLSEAISQNRNRMESIEIEIEELGVKKEELLKEYKHALHKQYTRSNLTSKSGLRDEINALQEYLVKVDESCSSLQLECNSLNTNLSVTTAEYNLLTCKEVDIDQNIASVTSTIDATKESIQHKQNKLNSISTSIVRNELPSASNIQHLHDHRNNLNDKRKDLWKQQASKTASLKDLKEQQLRIEKSVDSHLSTTKNVKILAQRLQIDVHVFYELISSDPKYFTVIENTANNSLFNIIVDTDSNATLLFNELGKSQLGRVTVMPMNRIQAGKRIDYPDKTHGIPLISKLSFDPNYTNIVNSVFAKVLVCPSIEVCSLVAKQFKFTCITLDGDKSNSKGVLTGGYAKVSNRLAMLYEYSEMCQSISILEAELEEVNRKVAAVEVELNQVMSDIKVAKQQQTSRQLAEEHLAELQKEKAVVESALEKEAAELDGLYKELNLMKNCKSKKGKTSGKLEMERMLAIYSELQKDKQRLAEVENEMAGLGGQRNTLESELQLKRTQLEEAPEEDEGIGEEVRNQGMIQSDLSSLEERISNLALEKTNIASSLETLHEEMAENERHLQKLSSALDRLLNKKSLYFERKQQAVANMKDLGSVPEVTNEIASSTPAQLLTRLTHLSNQLSSFCDINKKAFDQYETFETQRADLVTRKDQLDVSTSSIRDLINTLDTRKEEAIHSTFDTVSAHFSSIFARLVPSGSASMSLEYDETSDVPTTPIGIALTVSFSSNQSLRLHQLSGGQKTVVALATLFAIQRTDPSPFYLFDEVDAALDPIYRTSLAELLKEGSEDGQFICTTFRGEMVEVGDCWWGVRMEGGKSSVGSIGKDEAKGFVEWEEGEGDNMEVGE